MTTSCCWILQESIRRRERTHRYIGYFCCFSRLFVLIAHIIFRFCDLIKGTIVCAFTYLQKTLSQSYRLNMYHQIYLQLLDFTIAYEWKTSASFCRNVFVNPSFIHKRLLQKATICKFKEMIRFRIISSIAETRNNNN